MSKNYEKKDIEAIEKIRAILSEFYSEVARAILEYCLMVNQKDLEG